MVASHDEDVVARARKRSQQARESAVWYEHAELGYNYRMSNIVAAIGVGQLAFLEKIIQKKRLIFEWYRQRLGALVGFMPEAAYGRCTRWLTVAEIRSKAPEFESSKVGESEAGRPADAVMRVMACLEKENIESRPVWKPMHLQPVFKEAKVYGGAVSARLFACGVCLPSGTALSESDVDRACEQIVRALT